MPMRSVAFAGVLILAAVLATACGRAATLIPGDATKATTPTPPKQTATPPPKAGPILVSPTLELGARGSGATVQAVPDQELARSVMQVHLLDATQQPPRLVRAGSGVVINRQQRLVLTSYPLVNPVRPDGAQAYTTIALGANRSFPGEPRLEFEAEIVVADPAVDLAILRVVRRTGGQPLGEFDLPAARIVAGAQAATGDPLRLFGHPGPNPTSGAGSQSVTVTQAQLTGVRGEVGARGRAWLKTDARLPYGTQGGPAFDRAGGLIGVLVQPVYAASAPVAMVRPSDLAAEIMQRAAVAGPEARYRAPLIARPAASAVTAGSAIWVSPPAFAQNALDGPFGRDLFDYRNRFPSRTTALFYEFVAQGLQDGTIVEEKWFRDDVFQDQISSSYGWNRGGFATVSDRLATPNPAGLPDGRWRLEVWAGGTLRASATALVGVDAPTPKVSAQEPAFGTTASTDRRSAQPATAGINQLLFFFNYEGMDEVRQVRWLIFQNGRVIYQSPELPWNGGAFGRWWIGYRENAPLGSGTWEFELHIDGRVMLTKEVVL